MRLNRIDIMKTELQIFVELMQTSEILEKNSIRNHSWDDERNADLFVHNPNEDSTFSRHK